MSRKKVYAIFDTETVGGKEKLIYDLGLVIAEKTGNSLTEKRWIIQETMTIPNIARQAFYGAKIHTFYKGMATVPFAQARREFNELLDNYNVTTITAYNLEFDKSALRDTLEFTGNSSHKFLARRIEFFDLWGAACNSIFQHKNFQKTAVTNGWVSKAGNFRTNAETAYRYVTKDFQFEESHTALEDAQIETVILQQILRQKKRITRNEIVSQPWRKVQKGA